MLVVVRIVLGIGSLVLAHERGWRSEVAIGLYGAGMALSFLLTLALAGKLAFDVRGLE